MTNQSNINIWFGDNLDILRSIPDGSYQLIYIDPPFNTGKKQSRTRLQTVQDDEGDRTGFQGKKYRTIRLGTKSYSDIFDDYLAFLEPRLIEGHRILGDYGSFFFHIDYREVHYCKILLDMIFGRENFKNEIIWSYDYGARATNRWSPKHDTILWYTKKAEQYTFNFDQIDRIPYMAPSLVGEDKAARGKTPTDVWWNTIVSPNGKEKTGYPTQKPLSIIQRIIQVHSNPGDTVLDYFAGSGTTGEACGRLGRKCTLIDNNEEAMVVMQKRLVNYSPNWIGWQPIASVNQQLSVGL